MINEKFVLFGALLNLIGSSNYVIGTLKGTTVPNRVTWFLWALAPLIAFIAMIQEGVGLSALMTFMVGFGPLMIFVASFVNRKAYWKITRLDIVCGILSLMALILWLITGQGFVAIFFAILADLLAGIPTVIKAYKEPQTERYLIFLLGASSAIITLLTINKWEFAYFAFPLYILVICVVLFVIIRFPNLRFSKKLH